jgi:predicted MFS family arabinose efflux permease
MSADAEPAARAGTIRAALRHRDFRLVLVGYAVSGTGDWLYSVALVVYVFQVTGSPGWVAITSFVRFAPVVFLGTFGGMIADRYDRKRVLIITDLARFGVMVLLTIVALAEGPAIFAALCAGLSVTFASAYSPAVRAVIPSLVGEDDLASANTLVSTVENLSLALGPAIGGVLLLLGTPATAFAVNAATFLVSAACNAGVRASLVPPGGDDAEAERPPTYKERMTAGFTAIRSSSAVLVLVVTSVAFTLCYGQQIVLYADAANGVLGIGEDGLAFMWAAIGVGGILAAGITNRVASRAQLTWILTTTTLVAGLPMIGLAFVRSEPLVYALLMVEGAAVVVGDVVFVTMLQRAVSNEVLGRVFGILDSVMVAGILVGSLIAPVVLGIAGIEVALAAAGGLLVMISLVVMPSAGRIDREAAGRIQAIAGRVELLERTGIFAAAARPVLEALATAATVESVPAGTVVIAEGDPADDLFVVAEGTLSVRSRGEAGVEQVLRDLHAGDTFGEIGVLERRPRTATVAATTDCELYRIAGEDFLQAVSEAPRMSGLLVQTVAVRLARTHPSEQRAG